MTKSEFQKLLEDRYLFLDGATGTCLQKAGMPTGVCPEKWIIEHSEILIKLQKEYIAAGSRIVYAPTFTANRIKLQEYGCYDKMEEMIQELVGFSREAAGDKAYVAGDITMTGQQIEPIGILPFEELIDIYKEQIRYMVKSGVDLLVVETMMSLQETRAALIAASETCDLPVMVTLTFEKDGKTLYGTNAETAAVVLEKLGADAIGTNCSTGPAEMAEVIKKMREVTTLPLIGKPNAGLPLLDKNSKTYYEMDADTFAKQMHLLTDAGAVILGGCCGTDPDFIRKMNGIPWKRPEKRSVPERILTSERKLLKFGLQDPFLIIGERINPTGKKELQESLRDGDMDLVIEMAEDQEAAGASILDINMGMGGIDEKEVMVSAVKELSMATKLPLCIDTSHPEVMEAALRIYPGRALVNSISLEKNKLEKILPIAKKYGAMFILLPVSDQGIPQNIEEKKSNIQRLLDIALKEGFRKEDIIVDGLVTTVAANPDAALETLDTIRYCHKEGLATVCGLSNISFGLPERKYLNSTFLTMALFAGLTMAIANPNQELLRHIAFSADFLLTRNGSSDRFLEHALSGSGQGKIAGESQTPKGLIQNAVCTDEETAYQDILRGNRKNISNHIEECLKNGKSAQEILDKILMPAIDEVGSLYEQGTYFLPQLIASAETMKRAVEKLKPLLRSSTGQKNMPVIVVATVKGDVHDIGKNLVVMMLKNHGFHVIDLGKDVPSETIVQAAMKENASIIGLSALMTTTMQEMKTVIRLAKDKNYQGRIMIGGAVVTQQYADEIGADGFSADAAAAVKLAEKLCADRT